jgi:hypothetical protein
MAASRLLEGGYVAQIRRRRRNPTSSRRAWLTCLMTSVLLTPDAR